MTKNQLTVSDDQDGIRLDKAISLISSVGSRRRAREAIESGKVTINEHTAAADAFGQKLHPGDTLCVRWNQPGSSKDWVKARRNLKDAKLTLLYEDDEVLGVFKPPGLLTDSATRHQQKHRDTLKKRLKQYLKAQQRHPFIVHRIDRDTSGIVLVAKTEKSSEALRHQFRNHQPTRRYWVAVEGRPTWDKKDWVNPMMWDRAQRIQRPVPADHEAAFMARCTATVLQRFKRSSLLSVQLDSGRRNQIRLQAQLHGHPLIGERLYIPKGWVPSMPFERQALHAHRLTFAHPDDGRDVHLEAELPPDLQNLVKQLRRNRA